MITTTSQQVDGYKVTKYLSIVSYLAIPSSSSGTDMQYHLEKVYEQAQNKGADAIIGFSATGTVFNDKAAIYYYGTAVQLQKV